jgi:hypothetical protein
VLDAVNTALWLAVVALLETEARFPAKSRASDAFTAAAAALYTGSPYWC